MEYPMKAQSWFKTAVRAAAAAVLVMGIGGPACAQGILAARVNGAPISLELLDRQFEELLRERRLRIAQMQNPAKAKAIKREALDNLIRIELLWQQAKAEGLAASDEEVQRAVDDARGRFRSADAFVRRIGQSGFTEASYREHARKLLSGDRYAQRIVDREVKISEQDVQDFYELNQRLFKRSEQLKLRQIGFEVPAGASPEQRSEVRRRADAVRERARAGESFEQLAREHSQHATRQWGGALDPVARGDLPAPFDDAAFALAVGAVSEVIESDAALTILKLEERIPAATIPLQVASSRIREYLRATRGKDAIDREVESLRALGQVQLLTPL